MTELKTKEDFERLAHGDRIYIVDHGISYKWYYIGRYPKNNYTLILSSNHKETSININHLSNYTRLFIGKYDPELITIVKIQQLQLQISLHNRRLNEIQSCDNSPIT